MKKADKTNTIKALLGTLLASATILVALVALSALFYPKDNRAEYGVHDQEANGVLGEPENSLDVLFLGDSECYCSFSPLQMFEDYGFASYNLGTHSQRMYYGNSLLHRATEHQKPRIVVLETDTLFRKFSISSTMFQMMQDALPVFEYHNRWKSLVPEDFTQEPVHTYFNGAKGYVARFAVNAADDEGYMDEEEEDEERLERIPRLNKRYLQYMIDYCHSIGAEPILISTPSTVNWNAKRHKAVEKFAAETGVTYIDLNEGEHKVDIDWDADTSDSGDHMNVSGSRKVSDYVGAYLAENYDLPDHREDEAYANWHDQLAWFHKQVW
jgi:hypothetical protein